MQERFEIIMSIVIDHEYYENGGFSKCDLVPHPKTQKIFRDYRILFKRKGDCFVLLQEGRVDEYGWRPVVRFDKSELLFFQFKSNDSLFQTKTDIEFYASKDKKFIIDIDNVESEMNDGLKVLDFRQGNIILDNSSSKVSVDYIFKNKTSNLTESQFLREGEVKTVVLEEPGEYEILKDMNLFSRFIWNTHDDQFDGFFSTVISPSMNKKHSFRFPSRSLHWNFIVKSKYIELQEPIKLEEESERIQFEVISSSIESISFISKEKIRLRDNYDYFFSIHVCSDLVMSSIGSPLTSSLGQDERDVDKLILIKYLQI